MFIFIDRININKITKDHIKTFKNSDGNYNILELLFIAIILLFWPIIINYFLKKPFFQMPEISDSSISTILNVYAIIGGLLFNSLTMLIDRRSLIDNNSHRVDLLVDTFNNVSFTIIICLTSVFFCALFGAIDSKDYHADYFSAKYIFCYLIISFTILFFHHMLMILKRLHKILSFDIN